MAALTDPALWGVAFAVWCVNLPFGCWRAAVPKFSRQWFLPVPAVVALRLCFGLGWQPLTFAVLVGAFFLGQWSGGALRRL